MKTHILLVLLVASLATGCSSTAKRRAKFEALSENASQSQVEEVWGKPDYTEFVNGQFLAWYEDKKVPMIMTYQDGKLIRWEADHGTITNRQIAKQSGPSLGTTLLQSAAELKSNSSSKNCTTNMVGKTAYTNCN